MGGGSLLEERQTGGGGCDALGHKGEGSAVGLPPRARRRDRPTGSVVRAPAGGHPQPFVTTPSAEQRLTAPLHVAGALLPLFHCSEAPGANRCSCEERTPRRPAATNRNCRAIAAGERTAAARPGGLPLEQEEDAEPAGERAAEH